MQFDRLSLDAGEKWQRRHAELQRGYQAFQVTEGKELADYYLSIKGREFNEKEGRQIILHNHHASPFYAWEAFRGGSCISERNSLNSNRSHY